MLHAIHTRMAREGFAEVFIGRDKDVRFFFFFFALP